MKIYFKRNTHDDTGDYIRREDLVEKGIIEDANTGYFIREKCPTAAAFTIHMTDPDHWMSVDEVYSEYMLYKRDTDSNIDYSVSEILEALAFLSKHNIIKTLIAKE